MAWLWIVLGLLAIVGSMTWIHPTPMEHPQGDRRMQAQQLGMKVLMLSLDDWAKERLDRIQLAQYLVWTDQQPRSATLWRISDREEPWASPPEARSWDLLSGDFSVFLDSLPRDIVGVGADQGSVWVALDDAKAVVEPEAIKPYLDQLLLLLTRRS